MKKIILLLGVLCIVFATPVFAVAPAADDQPGTTATTKTRTKYVDDATGIRQRIQDLKEENAANREAKKAEIASAARNLATKKLNLIIKKFEAIQARVKNMPTISEDRRNALVTQIQDEIDKLNILKTKLASATTIQQVNDVMAEVKTQVATSKTIIKDVVDAIHATHLEGVIAKLNAVLVKIQKKIDALTGGETAEMKVQKDEYAVNIKATQDAITAKDFKTAKEKLLAARKNLVELNQLANAARTKTTTDTDDDQDQEDENTTEDNTTPGTSTQTNTNTVETSTN